MTAIITDNQSGPEVQTAPEAPAAPAALRRYIYCITDSDSPGEIASVGIDGSDRVFAVRHGGLTAMVSAISSQKLEITRGNAIAHQRVMEAVMLAGHTVLPVRFNTIAEDKGPKAAEQRIIDHVLIGRRDEILGLASSMHSLVELGVKGLWKDMDAVFRALVEGNSEIQSLRKRLLGSGAVPSLRGGPASMTAQIKLGERVKAALEARKAEMESALHGCLAPLAADTRKNKTFGDPMFANLALLVDRSRLAEVEAVLSAFETRGGANIKLRCVGPLPASNFLELVISWDD